MALQRWVARAALCCGALAAGVESAWCRADTSTAQTSTRAKNSNSGEVTMLSRHPHSLRRTLVCAFMIGALCAGSSGAEESSWWDGGARLEVTSETFTRDGKLPDSMIYDGEENGVNVCTANGAAGGDQSPQLSWSHVPPNTRSFVIVLYDPTAAFTHWGMYNIEGTVRSVPHNAGVADSPYGQQISNDFADPHYDGPCPPANVAPDAHHYVFTVYALDVDLDVRSASSNFPAGAQTLYHALIRAARGGHILGSGSLGTYYSSTPK
jgi:Raf kinase inhibitor-like YbhB/YbcL family protein